MHIIVIGGGAAGFFGAIRVAEARPDAQVTILERGREVLEKVRISGGGRCNLTHACFDPRELVKHYPRGEKELRGPFHHFACGDTLDWFHRRGVETKIEEDGRIFPTTDDSQTIIDCLVRAARRAGVRIQTRTRVEALQPPTSERDYWLVKTPTEELRADRLLVTTGSNPAMWKLLADLGHTIVPPVPSLFTFNTRNERLRDLAGVAVPQVQLAIEGTKLSAAGPLLVTHWGLSGPAILRLSAWGARTLAERQYRFTLVINWLDQGLEEVRAALETLRRERSRQQLSSHTAFGLPLRLWQRLLAAAQVPEDRQWAQLSRSETDHLLTELTACRFAINGKSTFKEEFVTAGGVDLREVDLRAFRSKLWPTLYLAGEVLDIDAITGGFNFQAAWTGGYLAGEAMTDL